MAQDDLLVHRNLAVCHKADQIREELDAHVYGKDHSGRLEQLVGHFDIKGAYDIAGQDDVDQQIGKYAAGLGINKSLFAAEKTDQHDREKRQLKIQHGLKG